MLIEGMDYVVRMMSLPGDVHAAVTFDPDGRANVYINTDLSPEARQRALAHEMTHVARDDLHNHLTIWDAEREELMDDPGILMCRHRMKYPMTDMEYIQVSCVTRMVFEHVFSKYITTP